MIIFKNKEGVVEKMEEEETKSMPHAPVRQTGIFGFNDMLVYILFSDLQVQLPQCGQPLLGLYPSSQRLLFPF